MNVEKEMNYQGRKIFYRIIGSGEPVMLIHGFGEDASVWLARPPQTPPKEGLSSTQPLLLEDSSMMSKFKFIIPDLPGSGKSEMIDDMSMEGMAELIKVIADIEASPSHSEGRVLESSKTKNSFNESEFKVPPLEGFREAIMIGHSMGGYITLAFAEKYPEYLNAFGLFHSSAFADSEEKKSARKKGIEFIRQHGASEFLKTVIPNLFSPVSKDKIPESINDFTGKQSNFLPAALVSYYEAMMQRPDRTNVLIKAKIPVLFIMGKYDNAVPMDDVLKQCHLPEKSYIHILEKSGHMGMMEEPDKSYRVLKEFLLDI